MAHEKDTETGKGGYRVEKRTTDKMRPGARKE
jgi:hypothetical protein